MTLVLIRNDISLIRDKSFGLPVEWGRTLGTTLGPAGGQRGYRDNAEFSVTE